MLKTYISLKNRVASLVKEDKGATAIEYGLIAAGVVIAIVAVIFSIGDELARLFGDVQTNLQTR
jgi:pilus assembly protein Flp/PilA